MPAVERHLSASKLPSRGQRRVNDFSLTHSLEVPSQLTIPLT